MRLFANLHEYHISEQSQSCKDNTTYTFIDSLKRQSLRRYRGPLASITPSIHHSMCTYPSTELTSTAFYVTILLQCIATPPERTEMPSSVCRKENMS